MWLKHILPIATGLKSPQATCMAKKSYPTPCVWQSCGPIAAVHPIDAPFSQRSGNSGNPPIQRSRSFALASSVPRHFGFCTFFHPLKFPVCTLFPPSSQCPLLFFCPPPTLSRCFPLAGSRLRPPKNGKWKCGFSGKTPHGRLRLLRNCQTNWMTCVTPGSRMTQVRSLLKLPNHTHQP